MRTYAFWQLQDKNFYDRYTKCIDCVIRKVNCSVFSKKRKINILKRKTSEISFFKKTRKNNSK